MVIETPEPIGVRETLEWWIRLRWVAVLGQILTIGVVTQGLHLRLPLTILLFLVALTALTNLGLFFLRRDGRLWSPHAWSLLLLLDASILTGMLHASGGIYNPFCVFYLVLLTMSAILLPSRRLWPVMGIILAEFVFLFFNYKPLHMPHTHAGNISFNLHLQGLLVAFVLSGLSLTTFINRLHATLKKANEELALSRIKATQNERFASLATLATGVAHELGSPLSTIAVISKDLEQSARQVRNEGIQKDALEIRQEISRCQKILEKLSSRSTKGFGEAMVRIRTPQLIEGLKANLATSVRNRLEENTELVDLTLPSEAVCQALAVLVNNAADASPPDEKIRLSIRRKNGHIEMSVQDQGTGISPDSLTHLGEPFFTTKEPGKGMGLGLFLVRTLALRLDGSLEIDSKVGQGTRVTLSLPVNCRDHPDHVAA